MRVTRHFEHHHTSGRIPRVVALAAILVLAITGCAGRGRTITPGQPGTPAATSTVPGPTAQPTVTQPPPPATATPPRRTATSQLAGFLSGAQRMDQQLRAVATLINADIGPQVLNFRPATVAAIRAIEPASLTGAIPGGMPANLKAATFLVFSELAARRYAFQPIALAQSGPIPRNSSTAQEIFQGLTNGSVPAARFASDLAALRTLAGQEAPIPSVAPDSRERAEVAVQVTYIVLRNAGCASSGGWWITSPAPITWDRGAAFGSHHVTGTVVNITFEADYQSGSGWHIQIHAC